MGFNNRTKLGDILIFSFFLLFEGPDWCLCIQNLQSRATMFGDAIWKSYGKHNYPEKPPQHTLDKQATLENIPLHNACRKGDLGRVRRILSRGGVDVNSRDKRQGRTPLMMAAQKGHRRIFDLLIRKGANILLADHNGNKIVHLACIGGHVDMVKYVLSQCGVDINSKEKSWKTPLMKAVYHGHRDVFEFLVSKGANMSLVNKFGDNILHVASHEGHVKMVKHILSHDLVNINSRGTLGRTALMSAAYYGRRKVFDLLASKDARISSVDDYGDNILHLATYGRHVEMVKHILSQNMTDINARNENGETAAMIAKRTRQAYSSADGKQNYPERPPQHKVDKQDTLQNNSLHDACKEGDLGRVRRIFHRYVVDVFSRDKKEAALKGHRRKPDFLNRKGANVSQVDYYGNNILYLASERGHLGMVKHVLSQCRVDINSRARSGSTPLMKAAYYGHIHVFDYLVCMGANISLVDAYGNNILHWACRGGHSKMVKHLLSQDLVNITSRGASGRTPLMKAAYNGHRKVFDLLASKGGQVSSVDDMGYNILHLASLRGHVEMVKHILSKNMVDINARDKDGSTAAMRAKRYRQDAAYDLLVSRGCPVQ
ncbi:ankyrin-1-like [Haliotis rufescens]|uniref:ankyrin-1-like n=1 Tax=Haliotis rufescens TaxID=6454 RepID=UPI00201F9145|nr:ankyrin-1-like [Haliotis rufescens]